MKVIFHPCRHIHSCLYPVPDLLNDKICYFRTTTLSKAPTPCSTILTRPPQDRSQNSNCQSIKGILLQRKNGEDWIGYVASKITLRPSRAHSVSRSSSFHIGSPRPNRTENDDLFRLIRTLEKEKERDKREVEQQFIRLKVYNHIASPF